MVKTTMSVNLNNSFDNVLKLSDKFGRSIVLSVKAKFVHFNDPENNNKVKSGFASKYGNTDKLVFFNLDMEFIHLNSKNVDDNDLEIFYAQSKLLLINFYFVDNVFDLNGPLVIDKKESFMNISFYNQEKRVITTIKVSEAVWNNATILDLKVIPSECVKYEDL